MAVVFIYGPPAVGKLTVARELARVTGFKLFDNHVSIDWARAIYEFGHPRFFPLLENLRGVVLDEAAREDLHIIVTFAFSPRLWNGAGFDAVVAAFEEHGRQICMVHLTCDAPTLFQRLGSDGREDQGKLTSPEGLRRFIEGVDLQESIPGRESLLIDNSDLAPSDAAAQIVAHFGLGRRATSV